MNTIGYVFLTSCYVLVPAIFLWLATKKESDLETFWFRIRFSSLVDSVKTDNPVTTLTWFFFCLRRMIFMFGYQFLTDYPAMQILLLNYVNLAFAMYHAKYFPYTDIVFNKLQMVNEMFVLFVSHHIMLFTPFISDKEV